MIKILRWNTEGSGEGDLCYRIDDLTEGKRFFRHLVANAECDGRDIITLGEVTLDEWAQICRNGKAMS